jgi:Secretion system C-terminal sorting domain
MDSALFVESVTLIDKKGNPIPTDVQIVLIHPCAGPSFNVCPSPAVNGRMDILLDTLTANRVEIYNETGLRVLNLSGPLSGSVEVNTQAYQPGLYYVRVTLPNGSVTRKVLILSQ